MNTSGQLRILIMFCIVQVLLKHVGMGDRRVYGLWVTWAGDAVFSVVGRHESSDTNF